MKSIKTVSFLGSGNVATVLSKYLYSRGLVIEYVFSSKIENATFLASKVDAKPIDTISNFFFNSDLVIVALKDDVIEEVLRGGTINNSLLVHTSGSFDTQKLSAFSSRYGCFYPFQTFRKEVKTDLSKVHFFIEANLKEEQTSLIQFAQLFSDLVVPMNSKERKSLHIAGVGVNNFTHYLLSLTKQYCEDNNLKTEYLSSLLLQTIQNSFYSENPLTLQTGPARRGDTLIIQKHLDELKGTPKFKKLYKTISQLILDEFHEGQIKL